MMLVKLTPTICASQNAQWVEIKAYSYSDKLPFPLTLSVFAISFSGCQSRDGLNKITVTIKSNTPKFINKKIKDVVFLKKL